MLTVAVGPVVRFLRSDRPDPVLGEVVGTDRGQFVIRTDDGRTHYRGEGQMTWVQPHPTATPDAHSPVLVPVMSAAA